MVLTSHAKFLKRIENLRERIGIPQGGFTSDLEVSKWYERIFSNKDKVAIFNQLCSRISSDFGLASNFTSSVETFLIFNKTLAPDSITISLNYDEIRDQKELKVQVFGEARESDWRRAWGTIKKLQKHLLGHKDGRFRENTNLLAEKIAYDMSNQGKDYQEIYNELKDKHFGSQNIEKLITNFKKRLQKFNS